MRKSSFKGIHVSKKKVTDSLIGKIVKKNVTDFNSIQAQNQLFQIMD